MNCQNYVNCPPRVFAYDATTPDSFVFIGLGFGPLTPPPLGWEFDRATAFSIYNSTISQADANQQAFNAAVSQAQSGWVPPGDVPPIGWENFPLDANGEYLHEPGALSEPPMV